MNVIIHHFEIWYLRDPSDSIHWMTQKVQGAGHTCWCVFVCVCAQKAGVPRRVSKTHTIILRGR